MDYFIILINYNNSRDTIDCITSLNNSSTPFSNIIIVENSSTDNSFKVLAEKYLNIKIFKKEINLGFSGGNNIGINYALSCGAEYILLLNNDTIVGDNFLEKLVNEMRADATIGIAAPQINYYTEPNKIWSAGGKISKIKGSGFADSDKLETGVRNITRSVNFVSGCCMLIKREVFERIGLLDENYFLYIEDTDFCFRTIKAGFKIHVVPESKIYHKVSSTTAKDSSLLPLYYATRNRLYFAKKNFPQFYYITFVYIILSMSLKSIKWLMQGKTKNVKIVYRSIEDFLKGKMGKTNINFG